jgi:hypothetical protein
MWSKRPFISVSKVTGGVEVAAWTISGMQVMAPSIFVSVIIGKATISNDDAVIK